MKNLLICAIFATLSVAYAQRNYPIFDRPCEDRKPTFRALAKTSFSTAAYAGTWFEVGRYQQEDEAEIDCSESVYIWRFVSRLFGITRGGRNLLTGEANVIDALALIAFPDASPLRGIMNVTNYGDRETADTENYFIVATDYFQYAMGWACEDLENNRSREFAWVLSRTPDLPAEYNDRVNALINAHFDRSFIRDTEQSDGYCLDRISPMLSKK